MHPLKLINGKLPPTFDAWFLMGASIFLGGSILRGVLIGRIVTKAGMTKREDDPVRFYIIVGLYVLLWLVCIYSAFREALNSGMLS
jgi:hypothetical protein